LSALGQTPPPPCGCPLWMTSKPKSWVLDHPLFQRRTAHRLQACRYTHPDSHTRVFMTPLRHHHLCRQYATSLLSSCIGLAAAIMISRLHSRSEVMIVISTVHAHSATSCQRYQRDTTALSAATAFIPRQHADIAILFHYFCPSVRPSVTLCYCI